MKTTRLSAGWVLGAGLALAAGHAASAGEPENRIANPSFEKRGDDGPARWIRYRTEPEQVFYGEGQARTGRHCVGIGDKEDKQTAGWIQDEPVAVRAGVRYRLSGWIRPVGAWGGNCVSIGLYELHNGKPRWRVSEFTPAVEGDKPWTRVEKEFVVPDGIVYARAGAYKRWAGGGMVYFDDVALEELRQPATPGNQPSADAAADPPAPALDWSLARLADAPPDTPPARRTPVATDDPGWRPLLPRAAGELARDAHRLRIVDTALRGVGWLGLERPAVPGRRYGFAVAATTKQAYHGVAGVAFLDADGKTLALAVTPELPHDAVDRRVLATAVAPPGTRAARPVLAQHRSGGASRFAEPAWLEYGEDGRGE